MKLKLLETDNNDNNNVAFKGAIQDFLVSSLRHELSPTDTLKWPGGSCLQITCNMSCVTWCEGTAQLLILTEFRLHLSYWLNH